MTEKDAGMHHWCLMWQCFASLAVVSFCTPSCDPKTTLLKPKHQAIMIGKLKGKVDTINSDHAIIDAGGVGYLVFCSGQTLARLSAGEFATLLIETHVREDHIHLYGFYSAEEKQSFTLLQSVKGVGTRMSLAILSVLSPDDIARALMTKDTPAFSQVSGVGKKLAERIINELKDKYVSDFVGNSAISSGFEAGVSMVANNVATDAISALVSLGVARIDAQNRINAALGQNSQMNLNELIKFALKN